MATSSLIRRALYRPDEGELDLLLTGGRRYIYSTVPAEVADGFRAAESKGRFYNAEIRNRFPCREAGRARKHRGFVPRASCRMARAVRAMTEGLR